MLAIENVKTNSKIMSKENVGDRKCKTVKTKNYEK